MPDEIGHVPNLGEVPRVVWLMTRAMLTSLVVLISLLAAAGPAAASRPRPAPPATAWTVYGDVIIELTSPKDPATGLALKLRAA